MSPQGYRLPRMTLFTFLCLLAILKFTVHATVSNFEQATSESNVNQFYSYITTASSSSPSSSSSGSTNPPSTNENRSTKVIQIFNNLVLGQTLNSEVVVQRKLFKNLQPSFKRSSIICPAITTSSNYHKSNEIVVLEHYALNRNSNSNSNLNDQALILKKTVRQNQYDNFDIPEVVGYNSYLSNTASQLLGGRLMLDTSTLTTTTATKANVRQVVQSNIVREFNKQFGQQGRNIVRKVTETQSMENVITSTVSATNVTRQYDWFPTLRESTLATQSEREMPPDNTISNLVELTVVREYCSGRGKRSREQWFEYYYLANNMPLLIETHYPTSNSKPLVLETSDDESCATGYQTSHQKLSVISMPVGSSADYSLRFQTTSLSVAMSVLIVSLSLWYFVQF